MFSGDRLAEQSRRYFPAEEHVGGPLVEPRQDVTEEPRALRGRCTGRAPY